MLYTRVKEAWKTADILNTPLRQLPINGSMLKKWKKETDETKQDEINQTGLNMLCEMSEKEHEDINL